MRTSRMLLVTLEFGGAAFERLDTLRRQHYPPERNRLPAHITLFHGLPEDRAAEVGVMLRETAAAIRGFELEFREPAQFGSAIAITVHGAGVLQIHEHLRRRFASLPVALDDRPFRPHVTLQDKVAPQVSRALLGELHHDWRPLYGMATGLVLWRFEADRWREISKYRLQHWT